MSSTLSSLFLLSTGLQGRGRPGRKLSRRAGCVLRAGPPQSHQGARDGARTWRQKVAGAGEGSREAIGREARLHERVEMPLGAGEEVRAGACSSCASSGANMLSFLVSINR